MAQRTCKACGTAFIKKHGRQIYCKPECRQDEHATVVLVCDTCGGPAIKEKRAALYAGTYCSYLCRDYMRWGNLTCKLPRFHISKWAGQSSQWQPPKPKSPPKPPENTGTCQWCGGDNHRSMRAKHCSLACKHANSNAARRARKRSASGSHTRADVRRMWEAFDRCCAYCSAATEFALIHAEHVVPLARGGSNDIANILPSCGPCNSDKRDLLLEEWNADRERRGLPDVTTSWDAADIRYAHLVSRQAELKDRRISA